MAETKFAEEINNQLKQHVASAEDWEFHETAKEFYKWTNIFNEELFDSSLGTPAIQIKPIRLAYGTYRFSRNGFGLSYEITLNSKYLDRPLANVLATLLHEQIHLWQELFGKPGKWNYHNKEFRRKAKSFGLLVNERGYSLGVEPGPFTELLARFGVDTSPFLLPKDVAFVQHRRGKSKMEKWSCCCTNVRCAVELNAKCLKCGEIFKPASPAW